MTFEESVRDLMRAWPSLYKNRAAVLDALFLHFGSGNYWHNGHVANIYADTQEPDPLARAKQKFEESLAEVKENGLPEFREQDLAWKHEFYADRVATIKDVLNNLEDRASGRPCEVENHFYPLYKDGGAPLQVLPDDCPADWVMGARETCALILACPFEETEGGDLKRSQRFARAILKDLDKRFGKAPLPDVSYATWNEKMPFSEIKQQRKNIRTALKEMGI